MKRIQINYKPLDKAVTLSPAFGSTVQQYNATIGEYVPDWSLVPLVINPTVFIADPDGKIVSGIKNAELTDINWYENKVDASTLIADSDTNYTIDRDSANNNKGRIAVQHNVDGALTLIFTARYLDTRTNQGVLVQGSILLRTEEVVDIANIRLIPSYPFGKRLYILTGQTGLKISCPLMNGQETVSGATYKWYLKTDADYSLITEGGNGITGAATSELWIPVGAMKKRVTFKTEVTSDGKTYTEEHILSMVYSECNVTIIAPGDGEVSPDVTSIQVRAEVCTKSGILESPETYYDFNWYDQNGTKLGSGITLSIAASKFSATDFAIEVRAKEKSGIKIWVADFKSFPVATLSAVVPALIPTYISAMESKIDCVFEEEDAALSVIWYTSAVTRCYIITPKVIYAVNRDSNGEHTAFAAQFDTTALGRHTFLIKCIFTGTDVDKFTIIRDGVAATNKEFADSFYDILTAKSLNFIEFSGGGLLFSKAGKLISFSINNFIVNFENRNLNVVNNAGVTTATLTPSGATTEQLITIL